MLSEFVDIHHHFLYGMDDGADSPEQTAAMLRRMAEQGVTHAAATPHIHPGIQKFEPMLYQDRLEMAREYVKENGLNLKLYSGGEILYTASTLAMLNRSQLPVLGESWHVLVEFHPLESYRVICHGLSGIGNAGYTAVLAHVERYRALRLGTRLEHLKEEQRIKIQMNCDTVIAAEKNSLNGIWARWALKRGLVDVIASDGHNIGMRACNFSACARAAENLCGKALARRMCFDNPLKILHEKNKSTWMNRGKDETI